MTLLEALREAHTKSGAPGRVTGFWGSGHYGVEVQRGEIRRFRFWNLHDGRVRVFPSCFVGGKLRRKQGTSFGSVSECQR